MRVGRLPAVILSLVAITGCTASNPDYLGGASDGPVNRDLANSRPLDSGAPNDLAFTPPDLSAPFNPNDGSLVVDFSFNVDLSGTQVDVDLASAEDLAIEGDLATTPADLLGADLVTCGNPGQACCGNNTCAAGGICNNNICIACGGLGQACCQNAMCGQGAACKANVCVACGGPGQTCCAGNACGNGGCCDKTVTCVAANQNCSTGDQCLNGQCANCGGANQACCLNGACNAQGCCAANTCIANNAQCTMTAQCQGGACVECGALGAACCPGNVCNAGQCDLVGQKCAACGGEGQACCANSACDEGGCCNNNVCLHAGRSCGNNQLCESGACTACGGANQPCCEDDTCTGGGCCVSGKTCVASGGSCGNNCVALGGSCGTCNNGQCTPTIGAACGSVGHSCCVTSGDDTPNFCATPGTVCTGGIPGNCATCGAAGQPCCDGGSCNNGGCCNNNTCVANNAMCAMGLGACQNGSCGGTCGAAGQPCCVSGNNTFCTGSDTRCLTNVCQACGGKGERACIDVASNQPLYCSPPYAIMTVNNTNYCQ